LETCWLPDGKVLWTWEHDLKQNRATWTQFWPDGRKKVQSNWATCPVARDLNRRFFGLVADGPAQRWNADGTLNLAGNFSGGLLKDRVDSH
jgi:hypothetical protein